MANKDIEKARKWCQKNRKKAVEICSKTGIGIHWFNAFVGGKFSNPGYCQISAILKLMK